MTMMMMMLNFGVTQSVCRNRALYLCPSLPCVLPICFLTMPTDRSGSSSSSKSMENKRAPHTRFSVAPSEGALAFNDPIWDEGYWVCVYVRTPHLALVRCDPFGCGPKITQCQKHESCPPSLTHGLRSFVCILTAVLAMLSVCVSCV